MVLGMIPHSLFCFAASANYDYLLILISLFLGAGAALIWNAPGQWIAANVNQDQTAKVAGLKYAAVFVGGFIGAAVGGSLIPVVSASLLFMGFGIFALLGRFCGILVHNQTIPDEPSSEELTSGRNLCIITVPVISGYFLMMFSLFGLKLLILENYGIGLVGSVDAIIKFGAMIGTMFLGSCIQFCHLRLLAFAGFLGCRSLGYGLLEQINTSFYCICRKSPSLSLFWINLSGLPNLHSGQFSAPCVCWCQCSFHQDKDFWDVHGDSYLFDSAA